MKIKIDWDLIIKYLEGNCSQSEKEMVAEWINESKENKRELELARRIWDTPSVPMPKPDIEFALKRVKQRIEASSHTSSHESAKSFGSFFDALADYIFNPVLLKVAGAVIFIFAFYFIFNFNRDIQLNELKVENKNISEIKLEDGSFVKLDAGSTLRYPAVFSEKSREVYLDGEAYFEVKSNTQQPFIIHANEGLITVLGTKFNVRAWKETNIVNVSVAEGKVSLGKDTDSDKIVEQVILTKGFASTITENGKITAPESIDFKNSLSWLIREKHFNNATLGEVLHQVERWYNLNITTPDPSYMNKRVTVFIENKKLDEILEVISLVVNLKYAINGSEIRFY